MNEALGFGEPAPGGPGLGGPTAGGPTPPPRSNGELVFDQPWQTRAFGLAAAAVEAGRFTWSEFQKYLIAEVAILDAGLADTDRADTGRASSGPGSEAPMAPGTGEPSTGEPTGYYSCWLKALERLLTDNGTAQPDEISQRCEQYATRAPAHDHHHKHDHHH